MSEQLRQLSARGQQVVDEVAQRHGFSRDAVSSMLSSVVAGYGRMAQFNHPEFHGAGQWMRGGMIMVSDMFNPTLKRRVESLCDELAQLIGAECDVADGRHGHTRDEMWQSVTPATDMLRAAKAQAASLFEAAPTTAGAWWPPELGRADSTGAQDGVRYAYFAALRRLAVDVGGHITLYDTLDHRIGGVSQQQSEQRSQTFTSQHGEVDITILPIVRGDSEPQHMPDIVTTIERLAELQRKGLLSDAEFAAKKTELLSRL